MSGQTITQDTLLVFEVGNDGPNWTARDTVETLTMSTLLIAAEVTGNAVVYMTKRVV